MNDFNNTLWGLILGVVIFVAIILFMVSIIYFEMIFLIILRRIYRILKRKEK
jgi:hypothetical protein